jgi:hypothetical protein
LGPFDFVVGKIYAVCSVREYVWEDIVQGDVGWLNAVFLLYDTHLA